MFLKQLMRSAIWNEAKPTKIHKIVFALYLEYAFK